MATNVFLMFFVSNYSTLSVLYLQDVRRLFIVKCDKVSAMIGQAAYIFLLLKMGKFRILRSNN